MKTTKVIRKEMASGTHYCTHTHIHTQLTQEPKHVSNELRPALNDTPLNHPLFCTSDYPYDHPMHLPYFHHLLHALTPK